MGYIRQSNARRAARAGLAIILLFHLADSAHAQAIYRTVDADGRVTFSDQAPKSGESASTLGASGRPASAGGPELPFELRQVVGKYPVTLYTSNDCTPCSAGRNLLTARGIPYTEKTVTSAQDSEALQRISGESSLPFLTIGAQQIKGYSDVEWTQFLSAAGYPTSSILPAGYRNPAPAPLVASQKQADASTSPAQAPGKPAPPPRPVPNIADNPTGITF